MNISDIFQNLEINGTNKFEYYSNNKKKYKFFNEILDDVKKVCSAFIKLGLEPNDKVIIIADNSYEFIIVDLACIYIGIKSICVSPTNDIKSLENKLSEYRASLILTNLKAPFSKAIISFHSLFDYENTFNLDKYNYSENEVFTIISTSGTTGGTKLVEVKVKNFNHLIKTSAEFFNFNKKDKVIIFLPLHVYLERCYLYASLLLDFRAILVPISLVFHSIKNDNVTILIGVPYFFQKVRENFLIKLGDTYKRRFFFLIVKLYKVLFGQRVKFNPIKKNFGDLRLLLTGSAPIDVKVLKFFFSIGLPIYEGYGMTEVGNMIALNNPGNIRIGSVGKVIPDIELKIDENRQILIRSNIFGISEYYFSSTEEQNNTYLENGYIATGDLGYIDNDGFLFLNGRIKNTIILSTGEKIPPRMIESILTSNDLIKQAVVFGNDKPFLIALIVVRSSKEEILIKQYIEKMNSTLKRKEEIKRYLLLNKEFDIKNGFLTDAFKINREAIHKYYFNRIEKLYM